MPYLIKVPLPVQCPCSLPDVNEAYVGSVWQCDNCQKFWELKPEELWSPTDKFYDKNVRHWTCISGESARKIIEAKND